MQDNYIVYYSLQFSCLLASQTGNGQVFFKDSGKHRLICPVALEEDDVFFGLSPEELIKSNKT